jgi:putative oxidoreductase
VILGAFVALVALPMAARLVVATFTVHLPYGFSSVKLLSVTAAGAVWAAELNLVYLACLAALVLGGAGPLAIDERVSKRRSSSAARGDGSPSSAGSFGVHT